MDFASCNNNNNARYTAEVLFRNYHVFEYSATNINRRVRRDVKICLITST